MSTFRKKPVEVEARRYDPAQDTTIADWCNGKLCGVLLEPEDRHILIDTLEGEMMARPGDYIIKGVRGEFYPCRSDIFEETYEPADRRDGPVRRFKLVRNEDETGVSGVGIVAYGTQFGDGTCVMRWASKAAPASTNVYSSLADVEAIHGHGGKTLVEWID